MLDFLAAIDKRSRPVADIEAGPHLDRQLHPGQPGHADRPAAGLRPGEARVVTGDAEATKLLRRPYREPWQHPA